ncbi:MAG: tetratricopeptide repeat-containing sensor histidine kinase [Chryseolinea sp.]
MKKCLSLLGFLILSSSLSAQNIELIKILKEKVSIATGREKFDALNDLAWEYRASYPDSTIYYAQQAFSLGKQLQLTTNLSEPLNFIGVAYDTKGDKIKSYEFYDKALKLGKQYNDSLQVAFSNNNLGRLFFEQGMLPRAYDYFITAQLIFENINNPSGLAYTYQSLARLYKSQGDKNKAENNYLKANKIRVQLANPPDITSAFIQSGRFYQEENQQDMAQYYFRLADSIANSIHDEINLAEVKTLIAKSFLLENKIADAQRIGADGLKVILKKNNIRMQPQAFLIMGEIEFAANNIAAAKKHFIEALYISSKINDLNSKMDSHYNLWKLSEKENNRTAELENMNQYLLLKDSINDLDLARQVERFQFEMQIGKKEQQYELLKLTQARTDANLQQQKLQNLILVIVTSFVTLLVVVQWLNIKKRRAINEKLEAQNKFIENQRREIVAQNETLSGRNQQLSDLDHEKDTLMQIVAHDLRSPLNRIKGLSDLMQLEGNLPENQKNYVGMIAHATQSGLDLITDLLDVHMLESSVVPNYTSFDISAFMLEKLHDFTPAADAKNIHLHISRVENEIVSLDEDYLHRILDNLVTNAIKFSNPHSSVQLGATRSNGSLVIEVKDQGQGFSESDKNQLFQKFKKLSARPTAGESSNGLGLAIVKTLVDRLNGSIELVSAPGKGSQFIIHMPIQGKVHG